MRIFFDQGVPVPLRDAFPQHSVSTAFELGWSDLDNGVLLARAQENHEVFITTDQNLEYQQNLTELHLAILVLSTTSWPRLQRHLEAIASTVDELQPGEYRGFTLPDDDN